MRIRSMILAAALVPSALLSVAATSEGCSVLDDKNTTETSDDIIACEASAYLACDTAHGGKVHVPSSLGTGVTFVDDAPTTSFAAGGGCGQQETAQATGTATTSIYDMNATGYIQGNVDTLTLELHSIYASSLRAVGETVTLDLRVVVGGKSPAGSVTTPSSTGGTPITSPTRFLVEVPLVTSSTGLSESMTVTITDLYTAFPELSKAGDGSDVYQTLDVTAAVSELDWAGVFVWGATEVPAGVTINGGEQGVVISALDLAPKA